METISLSTDYFGHTHRETISTRNSITIISHLSINTLNCFIIATKTYLCLYVSILWSDLESSRMYLWNKIPIPPFRARSNVNHPCTSCFVKKYFSLSSPLPVLSKTMFDLLPWQLECEISFICGIYSILSE